MENIGKPLPSALMVRFFQLSSQSHPWHGQPRAPQHLRSRSGRQKGIKQFFLFKRGIKQFFLV